MLQKLRMPQIRGGKGEAVLRYCEPLPILPMAGRHHTTFPKGKKHGQFCYFQDFTFSGFLKHIGLLATRRKPISPHQS
jgi:hypothetical protein